MASGGYRPGAGRPPGGISEKRRLLERAIELGLEQAGREKGIEGTADEVVAQTGASLVADMIRAGQGRDVLALWAQTISKSGGSQAPKPGSGSALADALTRVSGQLAGPDSSRQHPADAAGQDESATCAGRASATQSVAPRSGASGDQVEPIGGELLGPARLPTFAPQRTLPLADPRRPVAAAARAAGPAAAPPHPPLGATRVSMAVGAPPSEKISDPEPA